MCQLSCDEKVGMNVGVLGAGSWGTALALLLARNRHNVQLWSRDTQQVTQINFTVKEDFGLVKIF